MKIFLLWGNSGKDVVGGLPEFNQDYIFLLYSEQLRTGRAGIFVAAILAALVVFLFGASVRQKNELGMVMGFGCGMIILLNISLNFAGMLGWIPLTSTFLPFLSFGRNNILLCYTGGNYPEYLQIQRCISKKVQGVTGIIAEDHYFESEYVTW